MHESWTSHWLVVWVAGFAALLALAAPVFGSIADYLRKAEEEELFAQMLKLEPGLRAEWTAIKARDSEAFAVLETEWSNPGLALGNTSEQALAALGGLVPDYEIGEALSSNAVKELNKRPLLGML
jgi:hypothetical protein